MFAQPVVPLDLAWAYAWRKLGKVVLLGVIGLVSFLVAGNLVILGVTTLARHAAPAGITAPAGVDNFRVVDAQVWRGGKPTVEGYRALAQRGVVTVVDLRNDGAAVPEDLAGLGLNLVNIPLKDGQAPPPGKVRQFLDVVRQSPGIVFVHCSAGVGRTGSMVGAYLVSSGAAAPEEALRRNLAVGPPSLEQIAYVAKLGEGFKRPGILLTTISRTLDGPRRLWSRLVS